MAFLAGGSHTSRHEARLWLCQPTLATRPGVADKRAALLGELPALGLACEAVWPAEARYRTPHLEAVSLRTALAEVTVPDTWRPVTCCNCARPAVVCQVPAAGADQPWRKAWFGPVRIKRRASAVGGDLAPLVPGDVLGTVSRRDPIRERIGVSTSGNRVLGLANPGQVADLINRCHHDLEHRRFTLAHTLDHAGNLGIPAYTATRLFELLLVELQEHVDPHTTREGHVHERTAHP